MKPRPIPFSFVRIHLDLTWDDVLWGLQEGWLEPASVVEYAVSRLEEDKDCDSSVVDLAGLTAGELAQVSTLLEGVASGPDGQQQAESRKRWLYLALSWVYEHSEDFPDPLGIVEELYADFDYPQEMRSFVRYMPPEDDYEPQAHTTTENIDRLFKKWREYLDLQRTAR